MQVRVLLGRPTLKCTKVKHETKIDAIIIKRKKHDNAANMNVFLCENCNKWHLGHSKSNYRYQKRLDQLLKIR